MRLYIGNLQWGVTEQDLQDAFAAFGEVDNVRVVKEPETNRSRGFGFVTMATKEQGEEAMAKLNDTDLKGRRINVSEARERPARSSAPRSY